VNGISLSQRDAMEVTEEEITLNAVEKSHYILIEMKKE